MFNRFILPGLIIASLLLQACATAPTEINTRRIDSSHYQLSKHYQLPKTYQEHRNQQQLFTSDDGLDIAYTDHGTGETLVLIHGVPTSSWMYRKMIPTLQEKYRVITVDLIGYGSSDKPSQSIHYQHTAQAKRISQLMDSLKIKNYSLLFHDMGGLVAWNLLAESLASIDNLIVLNTIVRKEGFIHPKFNNKFVTRIMTDAFSNQFTSAVTLRKTFSNMGLGSHALTEKECRGYVIPMQEGSNHALFNFYTHLNDTLYEKLEQNQFIFERFNGNTLVLWGERDQVLTTQQIPFLQTHLNIPSKNIHIFSDNAHFLAEEIPDQLNQKINQFLK